MNQQLAYIHPEAKIADNVEISPFVSIANDVTVGEGTWIGPNVTIMEGARIGKNCKIYPGAVISGVPQDLKFKGEKSTTEIGDNTVIRECVTVNRGTASKGKTVLGNNCLLMAYVHVAHDCILKDNVIIGNATQLAGEVVIDDWAILSGLVAVHQFVNIGGHVMISGGSLVRKDVPPYIKAAHEPLAYAGVNSIGLRRRNFDNDKINEILEIYREIFLKGQNNSTAIENIETNIPKSKERDDIISFLRNSQRGIIKGNRKNE
jgi:UDP-N-acetylglucosamine acyltransferase